MRWDRRDLLSMDQFDCDDIDYVHGLAGAIEAYSGVDRPPALDKRYEALRREFAGKIVSIVSFAPTSRTRDSFNAAVKRLGGDSVNFYMKDSSVEKGKSRLHTALTYERYGDILAIRDDEVDSMAYYADRIEKPVINAGDGSNEHPTQALLDTYAIRKCLGRLGGLSIAIVGDLERGRVIHSDVKAFRKYRGNKITGLPLFGLSLPKSLAGPDYEESAQSPESLEQAVADLRPDVLIATRIQGNLGSSVEAHYGINRGLLDSLPAHAILLHPLPSAGELGEAELLGHPRFKPFAQVGYGVATRMAELAIMLGKGERAAEILAP
jgi:aspartate carbamoyltransferase catalytic subunit